MGEIGHDRITRVSAGMLWLNAEDAAEAAAERLARVTLLLVPQLSGRWRDVAEMMVDGAGVREIAHELRISAPHAGRWMRKVRDKLIEMETEVES